MYNVIKLVRGYLQGRRANALAYLSRCGYEVEDVVQDVAIHLFRYPYEEGRGAEKPYYYMIASRVVDTIIRREGYAKRTFDTTPLSDMRHVNDDNEVEIEIPDQENGFVMVEVDDFIERMDVDEPTKTYCKMKISGYPREDIRKSLGMCEGSLFFREKMMRRKVSREMVMT
jgi:DNA-directed RNA polymerase specialized sigma24 family protein